MKQNPFRGTVRTLRDMTIPFRALFLLGIGCAVFHLALWSTMLLLAGYEICDILDHLQKNHKKDQRMAALDTELSWERDPDDPESETLEGWSRVRLPREHQIVVTRVAALLRSTL